MKNKIRGKGLGGNYYVFMIMDGYTIFTQTVFLTRKEETFKAFVRFVKLVQNQFNLKIISLRTDHGGEFFNHHFDFFYDKVMGT